MTIASSGQLKLSNLQSEFGGSHPISISEYYRGGGRVPTSKTVNTTYTSPTYLSPVRQSGPYSYAWIQQYVSNYHPNNQFNIYWAGTAIVLGYTGGSTPNTTSYYKSGKTYKRNTLGASYAMDGFTKRLYRVYVTYPSTSTVSLNTGVPSSGTLRMGHFRGASKT